MVAVAFALLMLLVGILALRFPDYAIRIIGSVVILIVVFVGWYVTNRRMEEARRQAIGISFALGSEACDSDRPLQLTITNPDEEDIAKSWIELSGYRPGFSDPVYEDRLETDLIVPAGESVSECLGLDGYWLEKNIDPLTASLDWQGKLTRIHWRE